MSDSLHPMDCGPPGFSVCGTLQPRIPEWVAIPFPRDLSNPGIEPGSPALQADSLPSQPSREKGGKKKKKGGTVCHKRKGTKEQLRSVECRVGKISWFPFLRREK